MSTLRELHEQRADMIRERDARIAELEAEIARLREALEPFADVPPEEYEGAPDDMNMAEALWANVLPGIGDLRRARAALAAPDTGGVSERVVLLPDAIASLEATSARAPEGTLWRHVKSGRLYIVTGLALIEATLEPAILYAHETDDETPIWMRPASEFFDGRFVRAGAPRGALTGGDDRAD